MSDLEHYQPLKYLAEDAQHLLLCATHLQDGLVPVTSMTFDDKKNTFSFLSNRFCWEIEQHFDHHNSYFRVHCGVTFQHVQKIMKRNFHQKHPLRVLNLLTMTTEKKGDFYSIRILFSGDIEVDLEVKEIHCMMKDFQHPWPTQAKPMHWFDHVEELAAASM